MIPSVTSINHLNPSRVFGNQRPSVSQRLFRAVAQSAESARAGEKRKNELLQTVRQEIQTSLTTALYPLDLMLAEKMGDLTSEQKQALGTMQTSMKRLITLVSQQITQPKP